MNPEDYHYQKVIITPHISPVNHWDTPSFIGNISIDKCYTEHFCADKISSRRCSYIKPRIFKKGTYVYGGLWLDEYGHFILETLSRYYFIKRLSPTIPIVFSSINLNSSGMLQYQKDLLKLLNIQNKIIFLNDVTQFNDIYIPPSGCGIYSYISKEQLKSLGIIKNNILEGKKIYISRRKINHGGASNEDELEKILIKRGWDIIHPQDLTIKEQLYHYSTAETIFCINGSALHSMIFLKNPKQKFIVIPRCHNKMYDIIATLKSDNYYLLNISKKVFNPQEKYDSSKIFSLNLEQLDNILIESSDFIHISKISNDIISKPRQEKCDKIPEIIFQKASSASLENSLFYRILHYLYTGRNMNIANNCLKILLKRNLIKTYMLSKILLFVIIYFKKNGNKDIGQKFYNSLNCTENKEGEIKKFLYKWLESFS